MTHGNASCLENSMQSVPSIVTVAPVASYGLSTGFDPFGQIANISFLQLGENPTFGVTAPTLTGILQFDSLVVNHTIYSVFLLGT